MRTRTLFNFVILSYRFEDLEKSVLVGFWEGEGRKLAIDVREVCWTSLHRYDSSIYRLLGILESVSPKVPD